MLNVKLNPLYIYKFCIMCYLIFKIKFGEFIFKVTSYIYMQEWKQQPYSCKDCLLGWSMGANVCPKYEGVFRDHPEYSHSNSSNGVWNIPLTPSSLRRLSFPYVSLHPRRACLDGPSPITILRLAAVDINTLPKLEVGKHTDAFYKS